MYKHIGLSSVPSNGHGHFPHAKNIHHVELSGRERKATGSILRLEFQSEHIACLSPHVSNAKRRGSHWMESGRVHRGLKYGLHKCSATARGSRRASVPPYMRTVSTVHIRDRDRLRISPSGIFHPAQSPGSSRQP